MEGFLPTFLNMYFLQSCRIGNRKVHRSMTSSLIPPNAGDLKLGNGIIGSYDAPPPFLSSSQYFCPSEEVEGQLPELAINAVYDHLGKSGAVSVMMEMTDSKVLFHNVADL
jgi:hypothetical protein